MKKIIDAYRKDLDNMLTLRDLHLSLVMGSTLLSLLVTALLVCSIYKVQRFDGFWRSVDVMLTKHSNSSGPINMCMFL